MTTQAQEHARTAIADRQPPRPIADRAGWDEVDVRAVDTIRLLAAAAQESVRDAAGAPRPGGAQGLGAPTKGGAGDRPV